MGKIIYDFRIINKDNEGILDNLAFVRESDINDDVFIDTLLFYLDGLISLLSKDKDKIVIGKILFRIAIIIYKKQQIIFEVDFSLSEKEILEKIKEIFKSLNVSLNLIKQNNYLDLYNFLNFEVATSVAK
jgi:hypothetical protein